MNTHRYTRFYSFLFLQIYHFEFLKVIEQGDFTIEMFLTRICFRVSSSKFSVYFLMTLMHYTRFIKYTLTSLLIKCASYKTKENESHTCQYIAYDA